MFDQAGPSNTQVGKKSGCLGCSLSRAAVEARAAGDEECVKRGGKGLVLMTALAMQQID